MRRASHQGQPTATAVSSRALRSDPEWRLRRSCQQPRPCCGFRGRDVAGSRADPRAHFNVTTRGQCRSAPGAVAVATVDVVHVGVAFSGRHGPPRPASRGHAEAVRTTRRAARKRLIGTPRGAGAGEPLTPSSPGSTSWAVHRSLVWVPYTWQRDPAASGSRRRRSGQLGIIGAPPGCGGDGRRRCARGGAATAHRPAAMHRPHRHSEQAGEQQDGGHRTVVTPHRVRRRVGAVGDHDAPSRSAGFQFDG